MQDQLGIKVDDVDALGQTETVQDVIDFMNSISGNGSGCACDANGAQKPKDFFFEENLTLKHVHLQTLSTPQQREFKATEHTIVLVGNIAKAMASKFHSTCVLPTTFDENALKSVTGKIGGFVFTYDQRSIEDAFLYAKHLQSNCVANPFFVCVSQLNGKLGLGDTAYVKNSAQLLEKSQIGSMCGLAKSLNLEWDQTFCRCLDFDSSFSTDEIVESTYREIHCPDLSVSEVGYYKESGNAVRCTLDIRDQIVKETEQNAMDSTDVFVVIGGGKGITPHCVREIAKRAPGTTWLLMGRSALKDVPSWAGDLSGAALMKEAKQHLGKVNLREMKAAVNGIESAREIHQSLSEIRQYGIAEYISCDVMNETKTAEVMGTLRQKYTITGVIHASGVLRDKKIENKKIDDFRAVYNTKIVGLTNVLKQLDESKLRTMVVYSSMAGVYGNIGQTDYSMANEVLNKFAHQYKVLHHSCNVKSFCFGPWDSGMVTPALKAYFTSNGVEIIPLDRGSELVAELLLHSRETQIVIGNWINPKVRHPAMTIKKNINDQSEFLGHHMIQGVKVLPFTVIVGYIIYTVLKVYTGFELDFVKDVTMFKGINFKHSFSQLILNMSEMNENMEVTCKLSNSVDGKTHPSYQAVVKLRESPIDRAALPYMVDLEGRNEIQSNELYNGKTLFHGQMFQGIEKVLNWDKQRMTVKCKNIAPTITERGQFNIDNPNPYVHDLVYQVGLVWTRLNKGNTSLPKSMDNYVSYQAIESDYFYASLFVDKNEKREISGTCYFHNEQGELYSKTALTITTYDNINYF